MNLELEWNGQAIRHAPVGARVTLGGGRLDAVRLEGARPGLLTLERAGDLWTVRSAEPAKFSGRPFPEHLARVWLSGESLQVGALRGTWREPVASPGEAPPGTCVVARHLLGSGQLPEAKSAALLCLCGKDMGRRWVLGRHGGVLGRSEQAHLRLLDESISRAHLSFTRGPAGWWVEDLGGPNGLRVDGKSWKRTALAHGAVLDLGRVQLRFMDPRKAPAAVAPPGEPPAEANPGVPVPLDIPEPGLPCARDADGAQRRWFRTAVGLVGAAALLGLAWA